MFFFRRGGKRPTEYVFPGFVLEKGCLPPFVGCERIPLREPINLWGNLKTSSEGPLASGNSEPVCALLFPKFCYPAPPGNFLWDLLTRGFQRFQVWDPDRCLLGLRPFRDVPKRKFRRALFSAIFSAKNWLIGKFSLYPAKF